VNGTPWRSHRSRTSSAALYIHVDRCGRPLGWGPVGALGQLS
jgi:hypothetical protein